MFWDQNLTFSYLEFQPSAPEPENLQPLVPEEESRFTDFTKVSGKIKFPIENDLKNRPEYETFRQRKGEPKKDLKLALF